MKYVACVMIGFLLACLFIDKVVDGVFDHKKWKCAQYSMVGEIPHRVEACTQLVRTEP